MNYSTRAQWGAVAPTETRSLPPVNVREIAIHHTGVAYRGTSRGQHIEAMAGVQRFHQIERGWFDFAYNWAIFPDGETFEGRGIGIEPGATEQANGYTYAVVFFGNFEEQTLTSAALGAYHTLLNQFGLGGRPAIAHQQFAERCSCGATLCPGKDVLAKLNQLQPGQPIIGIPSNATLKSCWEYIGRELGLD